MSKNIRYRIVLKRGIETKEVIVDSLAVVQEKYCHNGWKCVNYFPIGY